VRDLAEILRIEGEAVEAPRWGEARYREMMEGDGGVRRVLLVAEMGEGIAGFVVGFVVLDEAEMENIAVGVGIRRLGVGRELCRVLVGWAKEQGAACLRLEVRAKNVAARRLYESLGFVECGLRARYYVDPVDDAVLMRFDLV
jgi:ribosomal-protein-alanine N-acetyltransferase